MNGMQTLVRLMHEFEKFVDNSFEKLPVRLQEAGVLPNNVHDVTSHDSLVILSSNHFRESQQLLYEVDEESFLCLFACKSK